jgi:uncharacterized membrane protein YsdA (DUF1294 family)
MAKRTSPQMIHSLMALACTLVLALLLVILLRFPWSSWYHLLAAWLAAINLVAFTYYGLDKRQAQRQGPRVPEVVLHGLAFAGGTLGAYLGMMVFRHKTVKTSFRLMFWLIAVLQTALVVAVLYRLWKSSSNEPRATGIEPASQIEYDEHAVWNRGSAERT